jgi:hypothetical protein
MWVFLAATLGACALIVVWAIGMSPDVGAVIGLAILGIGILIQMAEGSVRSGTDT